MAVTLFEPAFSGFHDANGDPYASGKVYTYAEGTTTEKATYPTRTDAENATNANANPVILDSRGTAKIWLAGSGLYYFKIDDANDVEVTTIDEYGDELDVNALPKGYISGLETSTGTDTDHDVDIAAGECKDAADSFDMSSSATITVAIDASGANGLDTGSPANTTTYALWLIADSSGDNAIAGLFSTSFSNPTLPSGYDKKRLISFRRTDGSANLLSMLQIGDYHRYLSDSPADVIDTTITNDSFETATLSVPPLTLAYCTVQVTQDTNPEVRVTVRHTDANDAASSSEATIYQITTSGGAGEVSARDYILVDSSSQVEYVANEASGQTNVAIVTHGCIMLTRSNPQ